MPYNGVVGITRYLMNRDRSGRGADRFDNSEACWGMADRLYRRVFTELGMPLADGRRALESVPNNGVGTAEIFDRHLGIDMTLRLANGRKLTLQEKILTTTYDTVTVEYMNDPARGIQGDWFSMLTQLLFIGYVNQVAMEWRSWILLNWPAVVLATARGAIPWQERSNKKDGAKANFLYAPMASIPEGCVWASSGHVAFRRRAAEWGREDSLSLAAAMAGNGLAGF